MKNILTKIFSSKAELNSKEKSFLEKIITLYSELSSNVNDLIELEVEGIGILKNRIIKNTP